MEYGVSPSGWGSPNLFGRKAGIGVLKDGAVGLHGTLQSREALAKRFVGDPRTIEEWRIAA